MTRILATILMLFASQGFSLPSAELSEEKNPSLTTSLGEEALLADVFTSEYMVVDISMLFCPYCRGMAESHNKDEAFQNMFTGDICKFMVVLPDADLEGWIEKYPVDTFIGERSYSYSDNMRAFAGLFGLSLRGVPTVMVLDRTGGIVAQEAGATPKEVYELCGGESN